MSRGPARWCAALGALSTALSPAQPPGTRAGPGRRASPTAGLARKKKRKKRGEGHWGRGRRRGPGAASSRQKIPRKGEGRPLSPFPPPPHPPKIIWKLLPTSSGTSDTFLHFQADKALFRGSRAALCEAGRVPANPSPPGSLPTPLLSTKALVSPQASGPPGAAGRAAEHQALPRARLVLG